MKDELLREFLREAVITELSIDHKFLNRIHQMTGLRLPFLQGKRRFETDSSFAFIALDWLSKVQRLTGVEPRPNQRAQVTRFVAQRMPGLIVRFHGDIAAAEQTMQNLLNAKFDSIK